MGMRQANAVALLASTTGAGIVVGSGNIDMTAIIIGSVATTVTIVANGVSAFPTINAAMNFDVPIALTGPVTATSSGGSFSITYRNRPT